MCISKCYHLKCVYFLMLLNCFTHQKKKKRKEEKVYKIVTEAHSLKTKLKIIIIFHRRRIRQTLAADDFTRCEEVKTLQRTAFLCSLVWCTSQMSFAFFFFLKKKKKRTCWYHFWSLGLLWANPMSHLQQDGLAYLYLRNSMRLSFIPPALSRWPLSLVRSLRTFVWRMIPDDWFP